MENLLDKNLGATSNCRQVSQYLGSHDRLEQRKPSQLKNKSCWLQTILVAKGAFLARMTTHELSVTSFCTLLKGQSLIGQTFGWDWSSSEQLASKKPMFCRKERCFGTFSFARQDFSQPCSRDVKDNPLHPGGATHFSPPPTPSVPK